MRGVAWMALGVMSMMFAVGTLGVSTAVAEAEVKMVFHVEGMR